MGKTLGEYMGWGVPTTHREHNAWCKWLLLKANRPTTTEYYLMAVRADIRQANAKRGYKVKMQDLKLKFSSGKEDRNGKANKSTHHQTQVAKSVWAGRVGGGVKHIVISQEEARDRGMLPAEDE